MELSEKSTNIIVNGVQGREAVKTLNTLQPNAQTLEKVRQERDKWAHLNIPRMWNYAERIGIQEKDVDGLNVIHVSGTKGKGSTCAFSESILRHHGYKTGFFSSPHLVEVRERLSVSGCPLEREKFASYFWEVYNKLDQTKSEHEDLMPNYFEFLTVMALHVFLQEQVDVAILEVGIGGEYDCTNMVRNPVACGVSSLGLDHTSILGTTIDKIAWHKAGIFKPGVPAFTVPQCETALYVIKDRATEIGAPLSVCPDISTYGRDIKLGIKGSVQALNASLSLQLCNTWIQKHSKKSSVSQLSSSTESIDVDEQTVPSEATCDIKIAESFPLTQKHLAGLEQCQWLGRNQTVKEPGITFYLDGAHTVESIQQCVEWFSLEANLEKGQSKHGVYRVLIYNLTGDREATSLLQPLLSCDFDAALFCPNIAYENVVTADQTNYTAPRESQLERCFMNKEVWEELCRERNELSENSNVSSGTSKTGTHAHTETVIVEKRHSSREFESHALPTISQCLNWVCKKQRRTGECVSVSDQDSSTSEIKLGAGDLGASKEVRHTQVLVTGSMHLVGGALRVLWDKQS